MQENSGIASSVNGMMPRIRTMATQGSMVCCLLVVFFLSGQSLAQTTFEVPIEFTVPSGLQHVEIADLDGDGDQDLAALSVTPPQIFLAINPGSAILNINLASFTLPFPPATMLARDLDQDGDADFVVVGHSLGVSSTVAVYRNLGALSFALQEQFLVPGLVNDLDGADFDSDDDLDLVFATSLGLQFAANDGTGSFQVVPSAFIASPAGVLTVNARDFDTTVGADLILTLANHSLNVLRTVSPFNFSATTLLPFPGAISEPAFGDFNGDGFLDLALNRITAIPGAAVTHVYLNTGVGGLQNFAVVPIPINAIAVDAGDVDADGAVDLVVASVVPDQATVLYQTTPGQFSAQTLVLPFSPRAARLGDLDGDGDLDIVTFTLPIGTVDRMAVYLNRLTPNFLQLEILSGDQQTGVIGLPYPLPLSVQVRTPNGVPAPGLSVNFLLEGGGAVISPPPYVTDAQGIVSVFVQAPGTPGGHNIRIQTPGSHPSGIVATMAATGPIVIQVSSGSNQNVDIGLPYPLPLVCLVTDTLTQSPIIGAPVFFASDSPGNFLSPFPIFTDHLGQAMVQFTAGNIPAVITITATTPAALAPAVFNLSASTPATTALNFTAFSGSQQIVDFHEPWDQVTVARVTRPDGVPAAHVPVTFTYLLGGGLIPDATVLTDANGIASTRPICGAASGQQVVFAALPLGGAVPISFEARARGLAAQWTPIIHRLEILFDNGAPGYVPLLVAGDTPSPFPPTPTVFGPIATSILNPGPGFAALDGLGLFGPPDLSVAASPTWFRQFILSSPPPPGFSIVLQAYGYDASLPFPASVFASNPILVVF